MEETVPLLVGALVGAAFNELNVILEALVAKNLAYESLLKETTSRLGSLEPLIQQMTEVYSEEELQGLVKVIQEGKALVGGYLVHGRNPKKKDVKKFDEWGGRLKRQLEMLHMQSLTDGRETAVNTAEMLRLVRDAKGSHDTSLTESLLYSTISPAETEDNHGSISSAGVTNYNGSSQIAMPSAHPSSSGFVAPLSIGSELEDTQSLLYSTNSPAETEDNHGSISSAGVTNYNGSSQIAMPSAHSSSSGFVAPLSIGSELEDTHICTTELITPLNYFLFLTGIGLEVSSVVFDLLSSPEKPRYALVGMLCANVAVVLSILELIYEGITQRELLASQNTVRSIIMMLPEITGFGLATFQSISSVVQFYYYNRHEHNHLNIYLAGVYACFCLFLFKFGRKLKNQGRPSPGAPNPTPPILLPTHISLPQTHFSKPLPLNSSSPTPQIPTSTTQGRPSPGAASAAARGPGAEAGTELV